MNSVNQAAYVPGSTSYEFGHDSIPNIQISGAPSDTNFRRWAMLHDGSAYRMYCFKGSTNNKIYQFAWDGKSYKYGHNSIPELTLTNIPADADAGSFSMLHSNDYYHLYMRQLGNPTLLYQAMWVPGSNNYEFGRSPGIPKLPVAGFPGDTDWARWSMLHDNAAYRLYAFKLGSNTEFYQGSWDGTQYKYGHNSIKVLNLAGTPTNTNLASMAMLHDNSAYRLYMQTL